MRKRKLKNPYTILGEEIYLAFLDGKNARSPLELLFMVITDDRKLIQDAYRRGYEAKRQEEYNASY